MRELAASVPCLFLFGPMPLAVHLKPQSPHHASLPLLAACDEELSVLALLRFPFVGSPGSRFFCHWSKGLCIIQFTLSKRHTSATRNLSFSAANSFNDVVGAGTAKNFISVHRGRSGWEARESRQTIQRDLCKLGEKKALSCLPYKFVLRTLVRPSPA